MSESPSRRGSIQLAATIPRFNKNVLDLFSELISNTPSHPTEGVLMRRMTTGRDAAPEGSASSVGPPGASGDTARPNYMGPSGNGLVGADERGGKPAESRAFRLSAAPVRFQKAVSGLKENAAARRRKARRPALWAGRSLPLKGQAQPQGGHGAAIRTAPVGALPPRCGGFPQRRPGARSPGTMAHTL